ncbi:hypothetical protein KM043_007185 [Ampulex compressa]|nr:hypothetical protein KM043_007185 [Ampulex compressa]
MSDTTRRRYTSIEDLLQQTKIDYKGLKPCNIYMRLPRMRELAEKARRSGDHETQYIMLKRWLDSVEWLKQTQEYRNDKSYYLANMRTNQINEVRSTFVEVNEKLEAKYKECSKKRSLETGDNFADMDENSTIGPMDISLKLPDTPTKDPASIGGNEEFFTCDQLFQLLQRSDDKHLIIDIRPSQDFEASRIVSNTCINIPASEIKHGITASYLEKYLYKDKRSFDLFKHRGAQYVDMVLLLDWNSSNRSLPPENHLNILKHILSKWDPGVKYKQLSILDGGYQEWLTRYPTLTTNPSVSEPSKNIDNEILEDIEYPDFLHSDDDEKSPEKSKKIGEISEKREIIIEDSTKMRKQSSRRENGPIIKKEGDFRRESEVIIKKQGSMRRDGETIKPTVDRSSKPNCLKISSDSRVVLQFTRQLNELAKRKVKLEQEILEQEHAQQDGTCEEEKIGGTLKLLRFKLQDLERSYVTVEEELARHWKSLTSIKFNPTEEAEKRDLDFSLSLLKQRIKDVEFRRKELLEKPVEFENRDLSTKQGKPDIHKEPLKTEHSSIGNGLERSYSSPNLLQLGDRKAPHVDRTSKPRISASNRDDDEPPKISHLSWRNREERMTPVHGTVQPGVTGLKNLGNSCYMNSIVQCLSNTTRLTKYFTDNQYTDDLSLAREAGPRRGQVVEEVAQVVKALWRGQYKSISPHDLKVAVGQYKLQFESYEQQDSHEFLTFLLEWMHNDLRKEYRTKEKNLSAAEKEWDKSIACKKSVISDLFFGLLRSTITCTFCKEASTTYETFNSLTVSLPQTSRCTLNECIQTFVTGQKVLGWKCPKCQVARKATKKFDFVKLSPIIVIHLNRFGESGGWLEKRNTAVDFPLIGLDLRPYLVHDEKVSSSNHGFRNYSYALYAMSNHYGTMDGGHYTAFCRNSVQNKWYKYDDQTVTEVSQSHVRSQNTSAYLLFYTSFSSSII